MYAFCVLIPFLSLCFQSDFSSNLFSSLLLSICDKIGILVRLKDVLAGIVFIYKENCFSNQFEYYHKLFFLF